MIRYNMEAGLSARWIGICFCLAAATGMGGQQAAAPVKSRPTKLVVTAGIANSSGKPLADVRVGLRDSNDREAPADHDLRAEIKLSSASGVQTTNVLVKRGSVSGECRLPLQEGGIIRIAASHPELRSGTTILRASALATSSPRPPPFTGPGPVPHGGGAPDGHVAKNVAQGGQTAQAVGDAAQTVNTTFHTLLGLLGFGKKGEVQSGILIASIDTDYLADGQDAAVIQVFLSQPAKERLEFQLNSSAGKLDPSKIVIEPRSDNAQARLTCDRHGLVTVSCAQSKSGLAPTNTLAFKFRPPIVQLSMTSSPPCITLLETSEVVVQLRDRKGDAVATDEPREITLSILSGTADIQSLKQTIEAGHFETRFVLSPTRPGAVKLQAFAEHLPAESTQARIDLPTMALAVSGLGGLLGGLLAASKGRRLSKLRTSPLGEWPGLLPWGRLALGMLTGFVLYWAFVFLAFSLLPRAVILNALSTFVLSLLGGWMGLGVLQILQDKFFPPSRPSTGTLRTNAIS